jgi:hypothetical protein
MPARAHGRLVEALLPPLVYARESHVVICQECRHCLGSLRNIKRHLYRHHPLAEGHRAFAKRLEDRLKALEVADLQEVGALPHPEPYTAYFDDLDEIQGYSCRSCPYLTSHYNALKAHLNTSHEIKGKDTRGGSLTPYYRYPIVLQTFSGSLRGASYFITSRNERPAETPPPGAGAGAEADASQILTDYRTVCRRIISESGENREDLGSKELGGFLLNSRWHEYFLENNKEAALSLLDKPDLDKAKSDQDRIRDLAYHTTQGLIPKLEGLIPRISRRNLQILHSETLNP